MKLFSASARWIWDDSDPEAIEQYDLRARRSFRIDAALLAQILCHGGAYLRITAESYYQVWLNGRCLGHGPAKSPEGERFLDTHELSLPGLLHEGENRLDVLVHALGLGTMSAGFDRAGLIFEIELPGGRRIPSDAATLVQRDPQRLRRTVRRWMMPCVEDVEAAQDSAQWQAATLVEHRAKLLPRPVPLPSRTPISPERAVSFDEVEWPAFSCAFRIKPYLVDERERRRCNLYHRPALIVTDLVSACDQDIELVSSTGQIIWFFQNQKLVRSSGWRRWPDDSSAKILRLRKGPNRLVGVHAEPDHFQSVGLAAFTPHPLRPQNPFGAGGFQIVPADEIPLLSEDGHTLSAAALAKITAGPHPEMDPAHTLIDANPQDLVVNARTLSPSRADLSPDIRPAAFSLPPPSAPRQATRLILDLGVIHNGWLAFSAFGKAGDTLTFSFFESFEPGAPLRIVWPGALNNVIRYHLRDGWQNFESLHAYGARYIAIHHQGVAPVELHALRLLSAHCGHLPAAAIRTGDVALDAIHALCENTLRAATDDTLTDCPTYEAVNWNFDNRLGTLADLTSFRNLPILRNTIEQYTRDPLYPGLVRSHTPSTWENRIPVFSFHWILLCRDFHWHSGDRSFVERVFPQVARGLEEALRMIDPATGLLHWQDAWHLSDWGRGRDDQHAIVSSEQALLLGALEASESLAAELLSAKNPPPEASSGLQANITRWRTARAALRDAIDTYLWQPDRDAFADSLHADGTLSPVSSQVSNAALALHGAGTPEWRARLHRRLQSRDPALLPFGSPMGLFYVLEFLDQRDDAETIFQIIREKWTPMLAAGDKTAWEHFPEFTLGQTDYPTRSRCHPFATYILKYYVKYLLGLTATAPGGQTFHFNPRPPADISACQAALPVAGGWIRVNWRRGGDSRIEGAIEAPPGITVTQASSPAAAIS